MLVATGLGCLLSVVYVWWLAGCHKTFVCSRENQEQGSEEDSPRGEQLEQRKLARLC